MTDEAKALVERLRDYGDRYDFEIHYDRIEAADHIEALETQLESANEALRERLDICETQAREIERLNAILSAMNDTDVIARTMAENERLRGLVRGWHYLAVGPDEMGDYYTQKALIKASEPYSSPALKALAGDSLHNSTGARHD